MRIERDHIRTACILGALGVLFALIVWLPSHLSASEKRHRLGEVQLTLQTAGETREQLRQLRTDVERVEWQIDATARYVPSTPQVAELLRELNTALQRHGATEIQTRHGEEIKAASYNVIPVTLTFRASFIDAFLFVEHVESLSRLVRVEKLDVLASQRDEDELLNVVIELSAFYGQQD